MIDVTERKRLEEQLREAHKMEAVGQLTAGIAHNFNNLLGIILPNISLCRRSATSALNVRLGYIEQAASRAAELVRQLTLLTRRDEGAGRSSVDLGSLVRRTESICRATFDPAIAIELRVPSLLPHVVGRAGELEQVLLNLCLNARDALAEAAPRAPRISLALSASEDGSRVICSVSDNGPGVPPHLRARVFEPFFTTKEIGKGTGLALASAYAIVTELGGSIRCECPESSGTSIVMELPVALDPGLEAAGSPMRDRVSGK